jgi:hypothetical protein
MMKARLLVLTAGVVLSAACGPRQVEVRTAPAAQTQITLQVNNGLNQGVNVYVVMNGTETFLRQVAGNSNVAVPIQGFAPGSTVSLKAVTVDGTRTYTRSNVVLSGTYTFPLP